MHNKTQSPGCFLPHAGHADPGGVWPPARAVVQLHRCQHHHHGGEASLWAAKPTIGASTGCLLNSNHTDGFGRATGVRPLNTAASLRWCHHPGNPCRAGVAMLLNQEFRGARWCVPPCWCPGPSYPSSAKMGWMPADQARHRQRHAETSLTSARLPEAEPAWRCGRWWL